jgi:hypothetical protein
MPKVKLLKTLMGSYSGSKDSIIEVPQYVAKIYVNAGLAERVKPCGCDECKDDEPCAEKVEQSIIEPTNETADVKPKRRYKRRSKKQ